MSELRERQAGETREVILRAVGEALLKAGPGALSVLDVAERAGVAVRTIYRHFGTKEGLLEALQAEASRAVIPPLPTDPDALPGWVEGLFVAFDAHSAWLEASLVSGAAKGLRAAGQRSRVAAFRRLLGPWLVGLGEEEQAEVVAVVKHLASVDTWRALRVNFGLEGRAAGRAVGRALRALGDDLAREREAKHSKGGP